MPNNGDKSPHTNGLTPLWRRLPRYVLDNRAGSPHALQTMNPVQGIFPKNLPQDRLR